MEEWDEVEERKFRFGDDVVTSDGDVGKVTELDGEEYRVAGEVDYGWFTSEQLTMYEKNNTTN